MLGGKDIRFGVSLFYAENFFVQYYDVNIVCLILYIL